MKRETAVRLLSLVLALTMVLALAACSNAPVEYSGDNLYGSSVTVDIRSIEPVYKLGEMYYNDYRTATYDSVVCQCFSVDGDELWVYLTIDQYHEYINEHTSFDSTYAVFSAITFASPASLRGIVKPAALYDASLPSSIGCDEVICFVSLDRSQHDAIMETVSTPEKEYSSDAQIYDYVYADVTRMEPVFTANQGVDLYYIYRCTTTSGDMIYVAAGWWSQIMYLSTMYHSEDNPTHSAITFYAPLRIVCNMVASDDICTGLSSQLQSDTLLTLYSIEDSTRDVALGRDLQEAELSTESANMEPVYADISCITPVMLIGDTSDEETDYVACLCISANATPVWIYMSTESFNLYFDDSVDFSIPLEFKTVTFDDTVRVHGAIRYADDLCLGLAEVIEDDTIIFFGSID